jgi:hypothetical protein
MPPANIVKERAQTVTENPSNPFKEDERIELVPSPDPIGHGPAAPSPADGLSRTMPSGGLSPSEPADGLAQPASDVLRSSNKAQVPAMPRQPFAQGRASIDRQSMDPDSLTPWKKRRAPSTFKGKKFLAIAFGIITVGSVVAVISAIAAVPQGRGIVMSEVGLVFGNRALILDGYKTAFNDSPNNVGLMIQFANSFAVRDKKLAGELYDACVRINPRLANCYMNRGLNYANLGERDKALADYNTAIKLNPEYALAYNNRGCLFMEENDFKRALADQNRAVQFAPRRPDFHFNRGLTYEQLNMKSKALADFEKCRELGLNSAVLKAEINRLK